MKASCLFFCLFVFVSSIYSLYGIVAKFFFLDHEMQNLDLLFRSAVPRTFNFMEAANLYTCCTSLEFLYKDIC